MGDEDWLIDSAPEPVDDDPLAAELMGDTLPVTSTKPTTPTKSSSTTTTTSSTSPSGATTIQLALSSPTTPPLYHRSASNTSTNVPAANANDDTDDEWLNKLEDDDESDTEEDEEEADGWVISKPKSNSNSTRSSGGIDLLPRHTTERETHAHYHSSERDSLSSKQANPLLSLCLEIQALPTPSTPPILITDSDTEARATPRGDNNSSSEELRSENGALDGLSGSRPTFTSGSQFQTSSPRTSSTGSTGLNRSGAHHTRSSSSYEVLRGPSSHDNSNNNSNHTRVMGNPFVNRAVRKEEKLAELMSVVASEHEERPICPKGDACTSQDAEHWLKNQHTPRSVASGTMRGRAPSIGANDNGSNNNSNSQNNNNDSGVGGELNDEMLARGNLPLLKRTKKKGVVSQC
eukprot:TRINITY_DN4660_c0_g1_i1.p1 TRINITY_DN4660_c0_g1~~TRINITY_DN4660_c0_g1_i1.p1  ORF type:complete len:405 (-),score=96.63 TRINITY_DN4660_c0_g1_i1:65-1279(-)